MWKSFNLVQFGIRDYSSRKSHKECSTMDIGCLFIRYRYATTTCMWSIFRKYFLPYINQLPNNVYLSIDIDGLEPLNCPNTGTPVPSGLRYGELEHLIFMIVKSGRKS